ncbi:MAG: enoyl-CoA hydratase-related protein [Planctomycetia bacterium]
MPNRSDTTTAMPTPPAETARPGRNLTIERRDNGAVLLSFFVPDHAQNVLTGETLAELSEALDAIEAGPPPTAVVVRSTRDGSFFAGADMGRLDRLHAMPRTEIERLCGAGRAIFARLSRSDWPSVAIIDGICLGGGLELALACDLRVATDAALATIGCPEVKLGLRPGWGGTVRLARLIGPSAAVELAASGENIDGPAAARLGLVDACVPPLQALVSACRLAELASARGSHLERRQLQAAPVPMATAEREFLESMAAAVMLGRSGGHYPAPSTILETILAGLDVPADQAARLEAAAFAKLAVSDVSRQLIRVFRLGERNRRDSGLDDRVPSGSTESIAPIEPRSCGRPAVIGAGIMGAGIAASHLRAGCRVALVDVQADALAASVAGILDEAAWDRGTKRTDPARAVALSRTTIGHLPSRLTWATAAATVASLVAGPRITSTSVMRRTGLKKWMPQNREGS